MLIPSNKSKWTTFVLMIFLGMFGVHRLYTKNYKTFSIYVILWCIVYNSPSQGNTSTIFTVFIILYWLTDIVVFLFWTIKLAIFGNSKSEIVSNSIHNISANGEDSITQTELMCAGNKILLHPDLHGLVWIADGKYRNYNGEVSNKQNISTVGGNFTISFSFNDNFGAVGVEEPSLIYTKLELTKPRTSVERPSYFPSYSGLTPGQRWTYLQLLINPYDMSIDIGYVFVLYYGLERHLLLGDFDRAFEAILKLRDVHQNKSFQFYSANALILASMMHKRGEKLLDFVNSLDKEYEYNFSNNLFLICYYSFGIPLQAGNIMRMAKMADFSNTNYIKKYPGIFCATLSDVLLEKYGESNILLSKIIDISELEKIKHEKSNIFANVSIIDVKIHVPILDNNPKLKKAMNSLLKEAHSRTKVKLSAMRKDGTLEKYNEKKIEIKKIEIKKIETANSENNLNIFGEPVETD